MPHLVVSLMDVRLGCIRHIRNTEIRYKTHLRQSTPLFTPRLILPSVTHNLIPRLASTVMSTKEAEAESANEFSYKKRRDPHEYATKDEREAEDDFLAPA